MKMLYKKLHLYYFSTAQDCNFALHKCYYYYHHNLLKFYEIFLETFPNGLIRADSKNKQWLRPPVINLKIDNLLNKYFRELVLT